MVCGQVRLNECDVAVEFDEHGAEVVARAHE